MYHDNKKLHNKNYTKKNLFHPNKKKENERQIPEKLKKNEGDENVRMSQMQSPTEWK